MRKNGIETVAVTVVGSIPSLREAPLRHFALGAFCGSLAIIFLAYVSYFALPWPQYDDFSEIVSWFNSAVSADSSSWFHVATKLESEHSRLVGRLVYLVLRTDGLPGSAPDHSGRRPMLDRCRRGAGRLLLQAHQWRLCAPGDGRVRCRCSRQPAELRIAHVSAAINDLSYILMAVLALYLAEGKSKVRFWLALALAATSFLTSAAGLFALVGIIVIQAAKGERGGR